MREITWTAIFPVLHRMLHEKMLLVKQFENLVSLARALQIRLRKDRLIGEKQTEVCSWVHPSYTLNDKKFKGTVITLAYIICLVQ